MTRYGRRPVFCWDLYCHNRDLYSGLCSYSRGFRVVCNGVWLGVSHGTAQFTAMRRRIRWRRTSPKRYPFCCWADYLLLSLASKLPIVLLGRWLMRPMPGLFWRSGGANICLSGTGRAENRPARQKSAHRRPLSAFFSTPTFASAWLWLCLYVFLMTATPLQIVNVSLLGTEEMPALFNGMLSPCLPRPFLPVRW